MSNKFEFNRYSRRIVGINIGRRHMGYAMRLYFKSNNGQKLMLQSKTIHNYEFDTKEIYLKKRAFIFSTKAGYSLSFIEEMLNKVGKFKDIKGVNLK